MKKNDFDNRLQNDLFPEMPASFERKLKQALESEGVKSKKRPTATGLFTGAISLVAAAAVLLIVLLGVLGGGRSDRNKAAAPGEAATTTPAVTVMPMTWPWSPKVFTLSSGFEFKNEEKLEALYTNILYSLMRRGESEPDELWLCAIKSRYVAADTGDRADGYLDGYYVLTQYAFGENDGPELYCLSEDFEVLWCTEGSVPGPNHAVNPETDNFTGTYQGHFLYGTEPRIPEPGVPHVTRGALVGSKPGTDVEFSMTSPITEVQERLNGSAHLDAAKEYFLITVSAYDWDSVMANPILRFETMEGPVDVNMEADVPLVHTLTYAQLHSGGVPSSPLPVVAGDQTKVVDLTGRSCLTGEPDYGTLILRALATSGEHIQNELWLCGVAYTGENEDGSTSAPAYVLALNAGDGEPSPELFYYKDGRILSRTQGADTERINVVYHNGNTIVFGKSPAFDNRPLAMSYGQLTLENGTDEVVPVLPLDQIQKCITGGPSYYSARECFLWKDAEEHEVKALTITAESNGRSRQYALDQVNVLSLQPVPAMAVESDGVVYPGAVTVLAESLDENGVSAEGEPLMETMGNGLLFLGRKVWQRPLTILTASDAVTVDQVDVYRVKAGDNAKGEREQLEEYGVNLELSAIDALPAGEYYLCFHTTVLDPYSEKAGRYTFTTDYTIYKVTLE